MMRRTASRARWMTGAEVDDLQPVGCLRIRQDDEAVAAPHLVLGGIFRVLTSVRHFGAVALIELGAEYALLDLTRDPPPGKHELDRVAQLSPRLLEAPDQRGRIEARRVAPVARPLGDPVGDSAAVVPFRLPGRRRRGVSRGASGIAVLSAGNGTDRDARAALELVLRRACGAQA